MFGPNGQNLDFKDAAALGVAYIRGNDVRKAFAQKKGYDAEKLVKSKPEELYELM